MGLSRRFVNLIVGDGFPRVKSLRRMDLGPLFAALEGPQAGTSRASSTDTGNQENKRAAVTDVKMEMIGLPSPIWNFETTGVHYKWDINCFPLTDRNVVVADQSGRTFLFDTDTRSMVTMPNLHKIKSKPISIFVPSADNYHGGGSGSLYVMERIPHPEPISSSYGSHQFEAFIYRNPTMASFPWDCQECQLLPPPPFVRDPMYQDLTAKITSHAVVDNGSSICISVKGAGTYLLDTKSLTWSKAGEWTLPFYGKVEYVPDLKLWFGLSTEAHHIAAADLSNLECQPQLVGDWKEFEPPEEWMELFDPQLVNLGYGRFCIARFFHTMTMDRDIDDDSFMDEGIGSGLTMHRFVVFTAVEINFSDNHRGSGKVELGMNKHKSMCHECEADYIHVVF